MYKNQNLPEERLELFRRWMEDAKSMIENAQAEQAKKQAALQADMQAQMNVTQATEMAREQGPLSPEEQLANEQMLPPEEGV